MVEAAGVEPVTATVKATVAVVVTQGSYMKRAAPPVAGGPAHRTTRTYSSSSRSIFRSKM